MNSIPFAVLPPLPTKPGTMLVHLLNRCNLNCRHCYLDASPQRATVLPSKLVELAIADARQLGVETTFLSGGEPLLYKDLHRLLTAVANTGDMAVVICTNATLVTTEEADFLRDHVVRAQVSCDGTETFHDSFRRHQGAFRDMERGISFLTTRGVPIKVVATISDANVDSLSWLARWAHDHGVQELSLQPLMLVGRGARLQNHSLNSKQLCELFLKLSDLGHAYRNRGLKFSLSYHTRKFLLAHPCAAFLCDANRCHRHVEREIKKLILREDGTVLPEVPTLSYRFAIGNLHNCRLAGLVESYFENGYQAFQRLCRTTYQDIMPTWDAPLVPWEELVSEYSRRPENIPIR